MMRGFLIITALYCLTPIASLAAEMPEDLTRGVMIRSTELQKEDDAAAPTKRVREPLPGTSSTEAVSLARAQTLDVDRITFRGATVLLEELRAMASEVEGKDVDMLALYRLRQDAEALYAERGYINARVSIPDQKVDAGNVRFDVSEGYIGQININTDKLSDHFLLAYLNQDGPFNLTTLQDDLKLLERDPRIDRVEARVVPGQIPGELDLNLNVLEARPWTIAVRADNRRAPSVGSVGSSLFLEHGNLLGFGDAISASVGVTRGVDDYFLRYNMPWDRWQFGIQASTTDSTIVEEPFNIIDIDSKTDSYRVDARFTTIRTLTREVTLEFLLERRENKTELAGEPFSFNPGAEDGLSRVYVARLGANWVERGEQSVTGTRLLLSQGLDLHGLHPTTSPDGPPQTFTVLFGQVQHVRWVAPLTSELRLRAFGQYAFDTLQPLERLAIGGLGSVRGYRQNQLVRDNGIVFNAELSRPVWAGDWGEVRGVLFADVGWGRNDSGAAVHDADTIESIGLGIELDLGIGLSGGFWWAHGFTEFESSDYDLQDDGLHFELSLQHHF